jgi:hypothetical protein
MLRIAGLVIALVLTLTFFSGTTAVCQVLAKNLACSEKPFDNTIYLKLTWYEVPGGGSLFVREADIYNVWERRFGFGIDSAIGSGDFFDVKPYVTFSNGTMPLTFIVGYDAASNGARYLEYGAFSPKKIGSLTAFAGLVNFSAVSPEARDYLDGVVSVAMPLNATYSAGLDLEVTHRWDGRGDSLLAGPALSAKIGALVLKTKFQVERHWPPGPGSDTYITFVGLRIPSNAF